MRIVDSGVLIGYFVSSDEHHARSVEILKQFSDEKLLCTTAVFQETVEFIRKAQDNFRAVRAAKTMLDWERLEFEFLTKSQVSEATRLMEKFTRFSFCDALTTAVAEERGIRQVLSFDSHFDAVKHLKRLS